jgi:membrane-bound lytic murein transglycosylase D
MKFKSFSPLMLSLAFTFTACSTTQKAKEDINSNNSELDDGIGSVSSVPAEVNPDEIDDSIDQELQSSVDGHVPEIGTEDDEIGKAISQGLPVEINENVDRWIDYFANKNHDAFQRFLDRGQPYKKMIVATLRDSGVPSELYYLAMIESGFVLNAHSSASAKGFWQFIPGSGRRYGLRVDRFVDERVDPWRATVAASLYLADLNNVFNSWYLAMAAYNAGEGRIMNAIMRGKTRDFWELVRKKALPSETMDYIPKVLAAYMVGKNPEKYGFRVPDAASHEAFAGVTVPGPIELKAIAEETQIPLESLVKFNPHLKSGVTPQDAVTYKIWIPKSYERSFRERSANLAERRSTVRAEAPRIAASETKLRKFHRVKRGEHLNSIASKYGLTVDELKQMNNLRSNTLFRGMKLKVMAESTEKAVAKAVQPAPKVADKDDGIYRVRRGDRLHGIAKKFGMSVAELKKMNKLQRNGVKVGQILRVSKAG